jgi:hypothetical protein
MDTMKKVTIEITVEVFDRVDRLVPHKRKGKHNVQEFWTQIFLDGLEHSRFINLENRRKLWTLEFQNSVLKQRLAKVEKEFHLEPAKETPPHVVDELARILDAVQHTPAKPSSGAGRQEGVSDPVGKPTPVMPTIQTTADAKDAAQDDAHPTNDGEPVVH